MENRGYDPMRLSRVVLLRHVQVMFLEDALAIDGIVATRRYLEVGNRCHEKVAYSIVRVTHAHGPLGIFMACFKSGIEKSGIHGPLKCWHPGSSGPATNSF